MIGNSAVGKTSLTYRYIEGKPKEDGPTTLGFPMYFKILNICNKRILLQINDTNGSERYMTVANSFYNNADGVVYVFDVSNKKSLKDIEYWME